MNAEADTHEALVAVTGTKFIAYALPAVVANEALVTTPTTLDAVTKEAVWAVVMNAEAETHEALTAVVGTNDIALAVPAVVALVAQEDVPASDPIRDPVNEAVIPVTLI